MSSNHGHEMESRSEQDSWTPNSLRGNISPVPVNASLPRPIPRKSGLPFLVKRNPGKSLLERQVELEEEWMKNPFDRSVGI